MSNLNNANTVESGAASKGKGKFMTRANLMFAVLVLLALGINVYFRLPLLKFFGFYEPDGFFHFAVIRAAVNAGFNIPHYLGISGWPVHSQVSEPFGLYWVTLLPYYFLRFIGINYYTLQRVVAVAFGVFDAIAAYYLARHWNKNGFFGILVLVLVGLSMGDAARTSATIYRGDGFVAAFLLAALIFLLRTFVYERHKVFNCIAAAISLSLTNFVWNGAPFGTVIYMFSIAAIIAYAFIVQDKKLLYDARFALLSLGIWFILVNMLIYTGQIQGQMFTNIYFFLVFAPLLILWLLLYHLDRLERINTALSTELLRLAFVGGLAFFASLTIYIAAPQFIFSVFVGNGFIVTESFAATIQELQAPTSDFLFASFGPVMFLSPTSILIYFASFPGIRDIQRYLVWFVMLFTLVPYLFLNFENDGEEERAVIKFQISPPSIAIMIYFAITSYLLLHAVRFNSLVAVPLVILIAYTIYWAIVFFEQNKYGKYVFISVILLGLLYSLSAMAVSNSNGPTSSIYVNQLVYTVPAIGHILPQIFILLDIGFGIFALYYLFKKNNVKYVGYGVILALVFYIIIIDNTYILSLRQADNINPSFVQALNWIKNNTPASSVFLTLWPDGSLIEGVANRTSITDSVGSQFKSKAGPFAAWIFNSSSNPEFLLNKSINSRPDYLLTRFTWLSETSGIFTEANLNESSTNYGYNQFNQVTEQVNSTDKIFIFKNPAYSISERTEISTEGGVQKISSYIIAPNGGISPFTYISFYNQDSNNYTIIKQTLYNVTNNELLVIMYSDKPSTSEPINITGVYIFNSGLAKSNMLKFLFFCNNIRCEWNNNIATMKLAYSNGDTKLYRILYNESAISAGSGNIINGNLISGNTPYVK